MSRSLVLLVALSCLVRTSALSQWNWDSPIPQGNTLNAIQFIDSLRGWAVGDYGTALRTTTGGVSWYEQEYGRTDDLLGVSMVSDTEGWSVGDNGTILHTTDAGDDWVEQISGISSGLNAVEFLDNMNGWTVGDGEIILHTSDGGFHWSLQHQSFTPGSLNALYLLSPTDIWTVGGNGIMYHSTDAGLTWIQRNQKTPNLTLSGVAFIDTLTGFAVGSRGTILQTIDGGISWNSTTTGDTVNLNGILMQNALVGWAVGDGGRIYRTINGGSSWSPTVLPDGNNINAIAKVNGDLWTDGELGRIYISQSGGVTWSNLDNGSRLSVNWVDFPDASYGYAVGQTGLIMETSNGGSTWSLQSSPAPSTSCYGVKFTDNYHGWAVGDNGLIVRTTDGTNWSVQASGVSQSLFGISFNGSALGWIVGGEFVNNTGIVLNSTDGGSSWHTQYNAVPYVLFGVDFPTPASGWAVGDGGYIIHTNDSGATWVVQPSGTSRTLFWCHFTDASTGWAVGDSGTILRTVNGGSTWSTLTSGTTVALYSISSFSPQTAVAAGDLGTILYTSDGGATWQSQYSRTLNSLFGIAAAPSGIAITVGDYGSVISNALQPAGGNTYSYQVASGWNLVSVPLAVSDFSRKAVYPTSTTSAFSYNGGGYTVTDTLAIGIGYWIKFSSAQTVWITGGHISADTIPMGEGWNLFGNLNDTIPVSSISTDPPGILESNFFGYANGYGTQPSLAPGKGYWVKCAQAGNMFIHFPSNTPGRTSLTSAGTGGVAVPLNEVTFGGDAGANMSLFFASNVPGQMLARSSLPPLPPPDAFDARFGSGRSIASLPAGSDGEKILLQPASTSIRVSWHIAETGGQGYRLTNPATGATVLEFRAPSGSATLRYGGGPLLLRHTASASSDGLPAEYRLFQNAPNPFNPSTAISFSLPVASKVELDIYNILGEKVGVLVNEIIEAGTHVRNWQPDLSSGVYFAVIRATSVADQHRTFTDAKKMLFLK